MAFKNLVSQNLNLGQPFEKHECYLCAVPLTPSRGISNMI